MPLNDNERHEDYGLRRRAARSAVWRWTPYTVLGFLGVAWIVIQLPVNSFIALTEILFSVIGIGIIAAFFKVFLRSRLGALFVTLAIGTVFAWPGAAIAWWLYYAITNPHQENKFQLCIVLGFMSFVCLSIGCFMVTEVLLRFLSEGDPYENGMQYRRDAQEHDGPVPK